MKEANELLEDLLSRAVEAVGEAREIADTKGVDLGHAANQAFRDDLMVSHSRLLRAVESRRQVLEKTN